MIAARLRHGPAACVRLCAEVTAINKQKFLTELGRLLTFMSEEDRIEALTLYEKMFDDADNEQALLQALQSPTRQAVVIARAYDAGARRQAAAKSAEDEPTPDFVLAILKVYEDVVPLPAGPVPSPEPMPAPDPVRQPWLAPVPDEEEPEEAEHAPVLENQVSLFDDTELPLPRQETPLPEEDAEETREAERPTDSVADFLADFQIEEEAPREETGEPEAEAPAEEPEEEKDELREWLLGGKPPERTARERIAYRHRYEDDEDDAYEETQRVTNIPLLILFVLIAVPLTVCGVVLLLVPTLASLVLSAAAIVTGCGALIAAFGGFTVFADILIVLGCAIVALALGLLFLWLFIWLVGGPTVGLVRWVIRLGSQWCSKEVSA